MDMECVSKRWRKHFDGLLNRPSNIEVRVLDKITQRPIMIELDKQPSLEVRRGVDSLNIGKTTGGGSLFAEIFRDGSEHVIHLMYDFIANIWGEARCPKIGGMNHISPLQG